MAITNATLAAVRRLRQSLTHLTARQTSQLTAAWVHAWDALAPEFQAAITDLIQAADGDTIPAAIVGRSKRVQDAMRASLTALEELSRHTDDVLIGDLRRVILEAADAHVEILLTQLPPADLRVVNFARTDPESMAAIVERTTRQITSLTAPLPDEQAQVMRQALVRGIALGEHPDAVARRILRQTEEAFNGGLSRAMTIARTEMLDAHREATRRNALRNRDTLTGWVWQANLDTRTCPSCLAMHGTLHPLEEFGPIDHPNGRCTRIDKTKSWADLGFEGFDEPDDLMPSRDAWWDGLTDDEKRSVLGPRRLELLNQGHISWDDMTTRRTSPGWRDSQTVTPLRALDPVAA